MMPRLGYRPALDGLRGVAILLVLVDHVLGWSPGGRGVDLFFVLSGFLITTLLMEERAACGAVSFRGFYARRARRLLPALMVFLTAYLLIEAVRGVNAIETVVRYGFYFGNFAAANDLSHVDFHSLSSYGLAHLWSLATEEQFYVLWPLVLLAVARTRRPLVWAAALLVAAELCREWFTFRGTDLGHLYYLPYGHSQGLIVGSFAALYRSERGFSLSDRGATTWLALVAVFVIASGNHSDEAFFILWLPLAELAFAMVVIAAVSRTQLSGLLAWRPLVAVGKISYSLYLWHFLFLLLFNYGQPAAVLVLSFACAVASYRFVEQPFRRRRVAKRTPSPLSRSEAAV